MPQQPWADHSHAGVGLDEAEQFFRKANRKHVRAASRILWKACAASLISLFLCRISGTDYLIVDRVLGALLLGTALWGAASLLRSSPEFLKSLPLARRFGYLGACTLPYAIELLGVLIPLAAGWYVLAHSIRA